MMSENAITTDSMGIPDTETVAIESSDVVSEAPVIEVLGGEQDLPVGEPPIINTEKDSTKKPRSRRAKANRPTIEAAVEIVEPTPGKPEKVALYVNHPVYWPDMGRLNKGYTLVNAHVADQWVSRGWARLATPEEVAKAFGV